MISDADRRRLHGALVKAIGPQSSEVLMELLPPAGWTDLATRTDIEIAKTDLRLEMQDLKGEIQEVRNELKGEIADVKTDLADVRIEIQDLRSRVDAQLPKLVTANIASMIGVAGIVITAGALI